MEDTNPVQKRSVLKMLGSAIAGSVAVGSASAAPGEGENDSSQGGDENSRKVVYADEDKRLVKVDDFSYVVEGDYTEEERRNLIEEYVASDRPGDVTTMGTDEGYASSSQEIDDTHYFITITDAWAEVSGRDLTFEGTASGSSYRSAWANEPSNVDSIKVTSVLKGYAEQEAVTLSAPPSYTVSYERVTAELTTSTPSGESEASRTLNHYEGAVTMEAKSCWVGAKQDDNVRFEFGGDAYFLGQAADLNVSSC